MRYGLGLAAVFATVMPPFAEPLARKYRESIPNILPLMVVSVLIQNAIVQSLSNAGKNGFVPISDMAMAPSPASNFAENPCMGVSITVASGTGDPLIVEIQPVTTPFGTWNPMAQLDTPSPKIFIPLTQYV